MVNFYITSEVKTWDGRWELEQNTDFPVGSKTKIKLKKIPKDAAILYFRAKGTGRILVNNKEYKRNVSQGYVEVEGLHDGDCVEAELMPTLHIQPLAGSRERGALMYGNILLAQLGPYVWMEEMEERALEQMDEKWLNKMLVRLDTKQLRFAWKSRPKIQFIPLYEVEDEEYSVYLLRHPLAQTQAKNCVEYGQAAYE